jgi:hypothetical protein
MCSSNDDNTIDHSRHGYQFIGGHLRDVFTLSQFIDRKKNRDGSWSFYHASEKDKDTTVRCITSPRSEDVWGGSKLFYGFEKLLGA